MHSCLCKFEFSFIIAEEKLRLFDEVLYYCCCQPGHIPGKCCSKWHSFSISAVSYSE